MWTSSRWEIKRSEPARVSISCAEADSILHWSKTASADAASKHSRDVFGLFTTLRPSIVDERDPIRPDLKSCCVLVDPPAYGPLAHWELSNWGLANRHLANLSRLIDGLWVREIGSAHGRHAYRRHHGKRCTRYDRDLHHGHFPLHQKKQGGHLPSVSSRTRREHARPNASTVRQIC